MPDLLGAKLHWPIGAQAISQVAQRYSGAEGTFGPQMLWKIARPCFYPT